MNAHQWRTEEPRPRRDRDEGGGGKAYLGKAAFKRGQAAHAGVEDSPQQRARHFEFDEEGGEWQQRL